MSIDLICPECGGIIGADASDRGRACTCATNNFHAEPPLSGDTVVEKEAAPGKVCCQCGKDLNGKKRLRDSRGYWCPACHTADKAATQPKGLKCADCGRTVPEAGLSDVDGSLICSLCNVARREQARERRRLSPVKTDAHNIHDRRTVLWMAGIVAILLLIIILRHFRIIGR